MRRCILAALVLLAAFPSSSAAAKKYCVSNNHGDHDLSPTWRRRSGSATP